MVPMLLVMSSFSRLSKATLSTVNWPLVAKPKSPILTLSAPSALLLMNMFSGLRSRWTMLSP